MNCENLQKELSLYLDDILSAEERAAVERHLPVCPLCRQKLSEYREIKNDLRMMSAPEAPFGMIQNVRNAISNQTSGGKTIISTIKEPSFSEKVSHWLLPYSVGTVAAGFFAFLLFTAIFHTGDPSEILLAQNSASRTASLPANSDPALSEKVHTIPNLAEDYPNISAYGDAPEVNPTGALYALTRVFFRGKMENEEVVVVADVFGDGLATITEVVEAPRDKKAMRELEKAFKTDPEAAPFLPPRLKGDTNTVRVVLKIQQVEITNDHTSEDK